MDEGDEISMRSMDDSFHTDESQGCQSDDYDDPVLNDLASLPAEGTLASVFLPDWHHIKTLIVLPFIQGCFYGYEPDALITVVKSGRGRGPSLHFSDLGI